MSNNSNNVYTPSEDPILFPAAASDPQYQITDEGNQGYMFNIVEFAMDDVVTGQPWTPFPRGTTSPAEWAPGRWQLVYPLCPRVPRTRASLPKLMYKDLMPPANYLGKVPPLLAPPGKMSFLWS